MECYLSVSLSLNIFRLNIMFLVRDTSFIKLYMIFVMAVNGICEGRSSENCSPGFAGHQCAHECSNNCENLMCDLDVNTGAYPCSVGCKGGFYGLQCNTPCQSTDEEGNCDRYLGTAPSCNGSMFGEKCQNPCECPRFSCDNLGKCHNSVCADGYYGRNCEYRCTHGCKKCQKRTGECLVTMKDTDHFPTGRCTCVFSEGTLDTAPYTGYLVAIIIINTVLAIAVIYIVYQNYRYMHTTMGMRKKTDENMDDIKEKINTISGPRKRLLENDTNTS